MRVPLGKCVTILTFVAAFFGFAASASAAETAVRTAVAPTLRAAGVLHPRISVHGSASLRIMAADPTARSDRYGTFVGAGLTGHVHPAVSLGVAYGFGYGRFPIEGPWRQEHRTQLILEARTPGRRVFVSNRARVDLRAVADDHFVFRVRPRNELSVTAVFRPWLALSLMTEGLVSPGGKVTEILQVRSGLALHGRVGGKTRPGSKTPGPSVGFAAGAQVATLPIAMWRARGAEVLQDTQLSESPAAVPVDLLVSVGLSGQF